MRILYLHGTFVPPPPDRSRDRFFWLSSAMEGDILQDIWWADPQQVEKAFGAGSYPVYTSGRFQYHFLLLGKGERGALGRLRLAWFFLSRGLRLHRQHPFDCVVTYGHTLTGLCGAALKLLTRAKLIIEIIIAPETAYASDNPRRQFVDKLKRLCSDMLLHISLRSCDRVHLLAPSLIARYKSLQLVPASVFFEGIPVSQIPKRSQAKEKFVILVGSPWRRKGVDLLIKAFLKLADDFPDVKLRLLGHYPDREALDALINGSPQIEILKALPNPEAMEMMARATVFALPSRCEGVPRVILEAMAAGVPVVASDVDGIPSLVRDGENGFLVPVNDVDALSGRLRQLLSDSTLREKMGATGYEMAHTEFSESSYVEQFAKMVHATIDGNGCKTGAPH